MESRHEVCGNCRFFCQDVDPENRLYFDSKSGECRAAPPRDHFIWPKTKLFHWCGHFQTKNAVPREWRKTSAHGGDDKTALLYRSGSFCQQAGIVVGYWNQGFKKWHDGGDLLLEREYISHWMVLPEAPSS
jgi:hypothetical protein